MKQTIDGAGGATYGGIALFQSTIGAPDFNFTLNAVDQATGTPLFVNNLNDGLWHHLSADLGAAGYAGFHISSIEAGIHNGTPTGTWDVYFANVALVRADGSVYQIFAGQDGASVANISGNTAAGSRLMTSGTERIDTANDPEIANTFYLADHLGTTQMEFSAGGAPVWRGEFAPFGEELDTQVTANHYKFTGKERDTESGLDYFGARYYASSMGRWMSPDWSSTPSSVPYSNVNDPQSLNLYSYVGNNPLSRADADGHFGDYYNTSGKKLGSDGVDDKQVHIVQNGATVVKGADGNIDLLHSSYSLLTGNVADFTKAEGQAIQSSVARTIAPGGNDRQGNNHEEGFMEDATGIHNKTPGAAYKPGDATVEVHGTLNSTTTMDEHTHPGGTALPSGTFGTQIGYGEKPSTGPGQDVPNARGWDNVTHVMANAGSGTVYVYNGSGVQGQVPLSAFPKPDKQ